MRRNKEQAERTKGRKGEAKSNRLCALRSSGTRACLLLFFSLIALHGLAPRAFGQDPVPQVVDIEVARPLSQPLQYRFPGQTPRPETEIEFKGNSNDWSFVRFDQLPENTSLRMRGAISGYSKDEPLQIGRWYPFKTLLPVVWEIKHEARMPVELIFSFGSPSEVALQELDKNPGLKIVDVRKFADNNQVKLTAENQILRFLWEQTVSLTIGEPAKKSDTADNVTQPVIDDPATHSWWTYFVHDDPLIGILALFLGLCLLALIWQIFLHDLIKRLIDRPRRPQKKMHKPEAKPLVQTAKPAAGSDNMYDVLESRTETQTGLEEGLTVEEAKPASQARVIGYVAGEEPTILTDKSRLQDERARGRQAGEVVKPPQKLPMQTAPLASHDGKKFEQLEQRLSQFEQMLSDKVGRKENLTEAAQINVNSILVQWERNKLAPIEAGLRQSQSDAIKAVEDLMSEQTELVRKDLKQAMTRIEQVSNDNGNMKGQLISLSQELGAVERRLDERLKELHAAVMRQTVPDSFYAKTLGAVVGQNVEALQDGNFEQLMGERINQFFQNGVARGEGLQDLRARAEAINAALKEVAAQMGKLNPQAAEHASQPLQNTASIVAELSGMQTQLQNQRVSIETTLRLTVSTHPGARQTFLDELGRGLRREIDKLQDPQSYFEGYLNRLVTTDLIAVVDICDKNVAPPPGSRPELEGALRQLFEQSGLRQILPRESEPFKTAEQDLVEMDQTGRGSSLTVARVITRGFYYKHRENETLLRKAGVVVYR